MQSVVISTAFGNFLIRGSDNGISRVQKTQLSVQADQKIPKCLKDCALQLQEYFEGKRKVFDVKIDWAGASPFHIRVWEQLLQIPYGHTTSYGAIAEKIGQPKATQAVGLANKNNPIAIIIPCHRCIGKNGHLTGYFYGLDMKQALLQLENPMSFAKQGSLF